MASPVSASNRIKPSNRASDTRPSNCPVATAGSRVSGSPPLIKTRSARLSRRPHPLTARKSKQRTEQKRRNALFRRKRALAKHFIADDYLFVFAGVSAGAGGTLFGCFKSSLGVSVAGVAAGVFAA